MNGRMIAKQLVALAKDMIKGGLFEPFGGDDYKDITDTISGIPSSIKVKIRLAGVTELGEQFPTPLFLVESNFPEPLSSKNFSGEYHRYSDLLKHFKKHNDICENYIKSMELIEQQICDEDDAMFYCVDAAEELNDEFIDAYHQGFIDEDPDKTPEEYEEEVLGQFRTLWNK